MRVYGKREEQQLSKNTQKGGPGAGLAVHGAPNSAIMPLNGISDQSSGYAIPDLEQRMQARLSRVWERPQAQIPQAEQEADRLSAAVQGGTPESVKSAMGRRMGADFSGVRFHTGAVAAAKADAMGARAYTSGADIYFGTEGFDPSVAAHELVHTAQQGIVDSGVATVAAPAGGVQMMENPLKNAWEKTGGEAIRKHREAVGEFAKSKDTWANLSAKDKMKRIANDPLAYMHYNGSQSAAWRKTGGRAIRKHHDAMNEFAKARSISDGGSGDWDKLTTKNKMKWIANNPLAYMHYNRSESAQKATEKRIEARDKDVENAREFLGLTKDSEGKYLDLEGMRAKRFLLTKRTVNGQDIIELGNGTAEAVESKEAGGVLGAVSGAAGKTDYAATAPGLTNTAQGVKWVNGQGQSTLGAGLGITNAATGIIGALSSAQETKENWKDATHGEQASGVIDTAGNVSKSIGGAAELLSNVGVEQMADVVPGAEAVTGFADAVTGARKVIIGARQFSNMRDFGRKYAQKQVTNEPLERMTQKQKDWLVWRQIAAQGEKEGERLIGEGTGKTITGALDATAGILGATGVGLPVAAGLKFASAASKFGFAIANHMQKKKMKEMVTKQTTGIDDQTIQAFMKKYTIKDYSRAKQALMKALGYESGYRAELYADQTEKRGEYLAKRATAGNMYAEDLAEDLNAKKTGVNPQYHAKSIANHLGGRHFGSRKEIAEKVDFIKKNVNTASGSSVTP